MSRFMLDDFISDVCPEDYENFTAYVGDTFVDYEKEDIEGFEECLGYHEYIAEYNAMKEDLGRVFRECLVGDESFVSVTEVVLGEGFLGNVLFSSSKLEEKRNEISRIMRFIYSEDFLADVAGMDCGVIAYDDGELKTYVDSDLEMFAQLGTALGEVSIIKPLEGEGTLYVVMNDDFSKKTAKLNH